MMRKILTALDGSKTSESVLSYLETLLASQDANVTSSFYRCGIHFQ